MRIIFKFNYWFLLFLFLFTKTESQAQCLTDEVTAEMCEASGDDCALADLTRADILAIYDSYVLDPNAYTIARAEVEARVIPVVFHIVHQCGEELITREQCIASLQEANEDFQGTNYELNQFTSLGVFDSDLDHFNNFNFELASVDEYGNATTGITYTVDNSTYNSTAAQTQLKSLIQWDPAKYLNVWVTNSTGGSAYAQFPSCAHQDPTIDGIVFSHNYLSTIGTANPLYHHRRHTMAHEIGHWLGLKHVWGDARITAKDINCSEDDDLCDTPKGVGFNDIVYPDNIEFNYQNSGENGIATFNSNGVSSPLTLQQSQNEGFGVINYYNYFTNNANLSNLSDTNGLPNSCTDLVDCDVNGTISDRPDNIYNMMDYGASFMFTREQVRLMVATLNCDVAGRSGIGIEDSDCPTFLPTTPSLTTITTNSYHFIESDFNNNLLKPEGVTLTLSNGYFYNGNILLETTTDLSAYGLSYTVELINGGQSAIIRIDENLENIPLDGLQNIELVIDLSKVYSPYSIYNSEYDPDLQKNILKIKGFEIHIKDNVTNVIGGQIGAIHHNYLHVNEGELCLNQNSIDQGYNYSTYRVAVGGSLINHIGCYVVDESFAYSNLLDQGFYLANDSPLDIEVLVNNEYDPGYPGTGNIPLLPFGTDIISDYDYNSPATATNPVTASNPYKYAPLNKFSLNVSGSQEIYGMARVYSESFIDNLGEEGYIGFRFRLGCEQAWFYAWLKMGLEETDDNPTLCLIEGQFQNIPYYDNNTGNYIVGLQECNNPYPEFDDYLWINNIVLGNHLLGNAESGPQGYTDNTNIGAQTNVNTGSSPIALNLETGSLQFSSNLGIFIDFNEPYGIYDYSELVLLEDIESPSQTYDFIGNIEIPESVSPGAYSMRVIHNLYNFNNNMPDYYMNPCNSIKYGEIEDYLINITDIDNSTTDTDCKVYEEYNASNPNSANLPSTTNAETYITVESRNVYSNDNVTLLAGDYILLTPIFEAEYNSIFEARIEECTAISDNTIFTDYPWLNGLVSSTDCCGAETITEYTAGGYSFIFIEGDSNCDSNPGTLYFQNGTFYCSNSPGYDCVAVYGLTEIANTWSCSNTSNKTENKSFFETVETMGFTIAPNPFDDVFSIQYEIVKSAPISIDIYSLDGQKVQSILDKEMHEQGTYSKDINGSDLPVGVYLVKLLNGNDQQVKRLVKMK